MSITKLTIENLVQNCVTDVKTPQFSFMCEMEQDRTIASAVISVNGWSADFGSKRIITYAGPALKPFTEYKVGLSVTDNKGEVSYANATFITGRMGNAWNAQWITDGEYTFTENKTSPTPLTFKKKVLVSKPIRSAKIYSTAIGIYEMQLNGEKVGNDYFAPGFTSYKNQLQYQVYDITSALKAENELLVTVAGGWAVGAFVMNRKNRITADRQAYMAEIRIVYADGSEEVIGTDTSWQVSREGNYRFAEFYDGEVYDATVNTAKIAWRNAAIEKVKIKPELLVDYGAPVREHEVFKPISVKKAPSGELIYDFGQNFAGIVRYKVNGKKGQKITVRHAEILTPEGELNTVFLRSAKCMTEYICRDGMQEYAPRMTYMGFRYAGISGVEEKDIEVEAVALYSDIEKNGSFECSNEMLNKLQSNIIWSGKSNFVDIPTDCPQRDERMGWTGDIAIFAQTACYNFDMRRFLDKWLKDVRAEQTRGGGIPNTVPVQGYGFPETMPKKAIAFWGDACVFVPWALYLAYGDVNVLKENYATMKKYVKACKFWANIGFGKNRYIWNDIPMMQFGDWVAPDVPQMGQWQARCKWTGTAALAASSGILSKIAKILGNEEDEKYYKKLNEKVSDAYVSVLTDGNGKLLNEFQTAYVLPLYFDMFPAEQKKKAAENLVKLIEKNDYCIGTGFPGTPYILFALADNGYADVAYKMLLNTKCPSWLYEVKVGATTVWERWDGLNEDGECPIGSDGTGGMISFNHYGFGAVGDFLYRRVLGIEPIEAGYKKFRIKPVIGGDLTYAKGTLNTSYGVVKSDWKVLENAFTLNIQVPTGTTCEVELPNGEKYAVNAGEWAYTCKL